MLRGWSAYASIAVISISLPDRRDGPQNETARAVERCARDAAAGPNASAELAMDPKSNCSSVRSNAATRTISVASNRDFESVDRLDEPRPKGFRFLGELKSSRGSVALCGPTWVGRTHAGVRCGISATRNSLRSQVPQKSKSPLATFMPSPDVHTPATRCRRSSAAQARARRPRSLLKLPPPQIIFCAATPASGLRPLVWVNAP